MKGDITNGVDVRTISPENFPKPPDGWKWQMSSNHLELIVSDEEFFFGTIFLVAISRAMQIRKWLHFLRTHYELCVWDGWFNDVARS